MKLQLPRLTSALLLSLMTLTIAAAARAEDQPISMRYAWKTGETIRYRMTQVSVSRMKGFAGGKGEAETQQTQASTVRIDILAVDDSGAADAHWTVETNRVEIRQPGGPPMILDSEVPADPADLGAALASTIVGKPISFHVTTAGAISAVSGVAPVIAEFLERFKDDPMAPQLKETLATGFSDDALRDQIERTLNNLPGQPVKIGDEWNRVTDTIAPIIGNIRSDERAQLVAVRDSRGSRHAEIRSSATQVATAPDENAAAKMTSSKSTSELIFDLTASRLRSFRLEANMDISSLVPPDQGGGTLTAQVTTTTSLSLIDEPPAPKPE